MEKGVPIRSISRSISVLQAINRHGSLSMISIARQSMVPYPTACRIVQTLIHEGLIEQEPARKRYRATALVQSLSHGYQQESELVDAGADAIRALTRDVGWPVSLAVRVGTRMVVRDSTHNQTSLTYERYYPGFTLPLLGCASGRLCLAHMTPDELENVMKWLTIAGEDSSPTQLHNSVDTFQKIRDEGYAAQGWGQFNLTPGKTSSIAVPVMRNGHFEAALTLIYFAAAMKQHQAIERYLVTMKTHAAQIEAALNDRHC